MLALELIPSGGAMKAGAVPGGLIVLLNNFLGFLDQTEQRRNSLTNIFDTNAKEHCSWGLHSARGGKLHGGVILQ